LATDCHDRHYRSPLQIATIATTDRRYRLPLQIAATDRHYRSPLQIAAIAATDCRIAATDRLFFCRFYFFIDAIPI
jgi:hypothetical protein